MKSELISKIRRLPSSVQAAGLFLILFYIAALILVPIGAILVAVGIGLYLSIVRIITYLIDN